ncbi:14541_t:CDS:2, partial [Racocetra fulgida]
LNGLSDDDIKKLIYGRNPKAHEKFWKHLGRMGTQCRDRWRDYLQHRKEKLRGKWTDEEEQKLINIIVELTRQNDADISLDWGIPWQQVSSLMENTRSPNQCRAKLYEAQKDDETSVDWSDLNDERWGPW